MPSLTVTDLVDSIAQLGTQRDYTYPSGNARIKILEIKMPEGPIKFCRWVNRGTRATSRVGSISINQLETATSAFSKRPNYPIHFDRLFSAGGNSRSALEALLAYTPHFFICYPQKMNAYTGEQAGKQKHIMWCPDAKHPLGELAERSYDQVIEVELGVDFGDIHISSGMLSDEFSTIEVKRTHTQMQVALIEIGNALSFRTWVARNDRSIRIRDTSIGNLEGVVQSLEQFPILYTPESKAVASLIDCIWFSSDGRYIPAVLEVEHSTGVTSGLTRMLKLRESIPSTEMNFTVVAPDELRNKVVSEANNAAFRDLRARFMPYSTVRELYGLIQRYPLSKVVNRTFIEPFMEKIVKE
jgi:type II restriction enzyme